MRVTIFVELVLNCEQLRLKFFHVLNGELRTARQFDFMFQQYNHKHTLERVLQADKLLNMLTNF